ELGNRRIPEYSGSAAAIFESPGLVRISPVQDGRRGHGGFREIEPMGAHGFKRLLQRGMDLGGWVHAWFTVDCHERAQIEVLFGQGLRFGQIAAVAGRDRTPE
ncbi:MAG TPA: hypothetical protein VFM54_06475, partial [Micromonosporaceae bacterium]|nr:hypothetical protein [Micromonosporaceae bacterium]